MKKTFFNNSTRGGDLQATTKTKRKVFRTFGFASLALLMGAAGVFAFAPLGANPNNFANANTLSDEINTKADGENIKYAPSALGLDPENDPVIYTTESGLEIKYGGENVNDQIASGQPLAGYPYFTMGTYNGYAVNWVIIGRNTNDTVFTSAISAYLYSTWKTNNNVSSSPFTTKAKYWFNGGGYETTTPAGSAINGVVPSKSYVADATKATKSITTLDGFLSTNEVYCITECSLFTTQFQKTSTAPKYEGSNLQTVCNNLPTTLGFTTAQTNMIVPKSILSRYNTVANSTALDITSTNQKFYPPAVRHAVDVLGSSTNLLNSTALRIAYQLGTTSANWYWCRGGAYASISNGVYIGANGAISSDSGKAVTTSGWLRVCCVVNFG